MTVIRDTHKEFEGRATNAMTFAGNYTADESSGHGTHVAGIIGGKTYGVAKQTMIIGVTVLDAEGNGTSSNLVAALQWVHDDALKHERASRSVVNMSLGVKGKSAALDDAIKALKESGILVVTAAGNDNANTAEYTPANSPDAFTVGAVDSQNQRAPYSNWGPGVQIYAPGHSILSVGYENDEAVVYRTGSSMACPHVAGLASYFKGLYGLDDPNDVIQTILKYAVNGTVGDPKGGYNAVASNGQNKQIKFEL